MIFECWWADQPDPFFLPLLFYAADGYDDCPANEGIVEVKLDPLPPVRHKPHRANRIGNRCCRDLDAVATRWAK